MASTRNAARPARQSARRRRFWNYPRPNKGPVGRWLPSWRIILGAILALVALGVGAFAMAWASVRIPDNLDSVNDQATSVYWADGSEMGTFALQKRVIVNYEDLPKHIGDAVVASEDQSFWTNIGIDPKGIVRSAWNNVRGGSLQGASTLTQQYVERYYTDTTTSYVGKAKEAIIALKVAQAQPKEQVLENYLNTIYWGRGAYGVEAASQAYFGKSAKDLTYSESALLAGVIPSPSNWDPEVNPEQAQARWERSIDRMAEAGYITDAERQQAQFPEVKPKPAASNSKGGQTGYILEEVRKELVRSGQFTEEQLDTGGYKITTTIDPKLQQTAADTAAGLWQGDDPASPDLRAAIVSIDPNTGEIRALYGGQDYVEQPFNTATQDHFQAGSTFKPFTLIAALRDGHKLTERFNGNSGLRLPGWEDTEFGLRNFGDQPWGRINLITATAHSVNTVYAALNLEIGPEKTVETAVDLGIPEDTQDLDAVASNVLGTASVRPVDLAAAYSTIAAQGQRTTPHLVASVTTLDDEPVYSGPTKQTEVVDPDVMAAATYAMTKVVEDGSGKVAQEVRGPNGEHRPIAGKTGTSNDNMSAWFAGFTPQLATVVGLHQVENVDGKATTVPIEDFGGYDEITGSTWPVRAWTDYMKVALEGVPVEDFPAYTPPVTRSTAQPSPTPSDTPSPTPTPSETPEEELVTVPGDMVGWQVGPAQNTLANLGLQAAMQEQPSDQPKGTVIQVGSAGQQVPKGSTVALIVSSGPEQEQEEEPEPEPEPTETEEPQPSASPTRGQGPNGLLGGGNNGTGNGNRDG
ncbi:transglycosylase domain-containing protein [Puerhibacterium sp. TATVAM-FAB25]|uniref:transglycosylase domain-containing protein n=1 Tax=Puerhibacterium sp. TATVAM-FAB25 TaxID=3093699 RepID=UPI00397ABB4B